MQINFTWLSTEAEVLSGLQVMAHLRPQLPVAVMQAQVARQQQAGYRLLGAWADSRCVAVAGLVIGEKLAWGKHLYIDDLVTDPDYRSSGVGQALFDECVRFAREQHCQSLHLDSGVQRFAAHRFYLRNRMQIASHHFALEL